MARLITCVLVALCFATTLGCNQGGGGTTASIPAATTEPATGGDETPTATPPALGSEPTPVVSTTPPHPQVWVRTSLGDFKLKLDAVNAPQTVDNFLENYVDRGFYTDTIFHYTDPEYILVGGGYTADLEAKETRASISNESYNGLNNVKGTISMARDPEYPDSATSQFIINIVDNPELDYVDGEGDGYAVFGSVVEGLDVIEKIATTAVEDNGEFQRLPVEAVVIKAIERVE